MGQEAEQKAAEAQIETPAVSEDSTKKPEQPVAKTESSEDEGDFSTWEPAKVKDYVKKLRNENKSYRQKAKGLEERLGKIETGLQTMFGKDEQQTDPETRIAKLTEVNQAKERRLTILESAIASGISGKESIDYFEFLVSKKLASDSEKNLSEDDLQEIVQKVNQVHGSTKPSKTTITHEKGKPEAESKDTVDLNQFMKMSVLAKSELFRTNEALYNRLLKEARDAKLFV